MKTVNWDLAKLSEKSSKSKLELAKTIISALLASGVRHRIVLSCKDIKPIL